MRRPRTARLLQAILSATLSKWLPRQLGVWRLKVDPLQQIRERLADAAPAKAIPFLIAVENMRANQRDHRQRVRDSHLMGAKALGMEGLVGKSQSEDDMGDIIVTGDITQRSDGAKPTSALGTAATAAIGAGTLAAGMLLNNWMQPATAPGVQPQPTVQQAEDARRLEAGLSVERGGALNQ